MASIRIPLVTGSVMFVGLVIVALDGDDVVSAVAEHMYCVILHVFNCRTDAEDDDDDDRNNCRVVV